MTTIEKIIKKWEDNFKKIDWPWLPLEEWSAYWAINEFLNDLKSIECLQVENEELINNLPLKKIYSEMISERVEVIDEISQHWNAWLNCWIMILEQHLTSKPKEEECINKSKLN